MVLTIGGMVDSSYLIWKHRQKKPLVCPLEHKCDVVTESKWSHLFYFRNETLGFLFYLSLFLGALLFLFIPAWQANFLLLFLLATSGGVLFSLFLIYLQIYVIKDYCFYCLISAGITFLLLVMSGLLYLG
ncbi:MAG: vitamin K epoxide reductase [archaeon GW2011_AR9]|nr:MAG: vitamin K epoxide reductase [archaeon GW2011_AR9]MBS3120370.1 vitamin K epoxide reductase family protein [Candidatus Woesearchaeota archaeon]HIG92862.1 vitamin K epoxide reductase family protein [Candidatus Woesearchaeota archaeon]HIH13163.1 vitamin K epoxide reductase family protein [Candidatus Woesearchaeota archaeon]